MGREVQAPPIFGYDLSKGRVRAPKYSRQKGPKTILSSWGVKNQTEKITRTQTEIRIDLANQTVPNSNTNIQSDEKPTYYMTQSYK